MSGGMLESRAGNGVILHCVEHCELSTFPAPLLDPRSTPQSHDNWKLTNSWETPLGGTVSPPGVYWLRLMLVVARGQQVPPPVDQRTARREGTCSFCLRVVPRLLSAPHPPIDYSWNVLVGLASEINPRGWHRLASAVKGVMSSWAHLGIGGFHLGRRWSWYRWLHRRTCWESMCHSG